MEEATTRNRFAAKRTKKRETDAVVEKPVTNLTPVESPVAAMADFNSDLGEIDLVSRAESNPRKQYIRSRTVTMRFLESKLDKLDELRGHVPLQKLTENLYDMYIEQKTRAMETR